MSPPPSRKRLAPHLRDPSWYRILYAQGAQGLHFDASGRHDEKLREQLEGLAHELGLPPREKANQSLEQARNDLQTLLHATTMVLQDARWRWPRRRPPVWARALAWFGRPRWRTGTRRRLLDDFLDRTVEPAAVIALLSIHVREGRIRCLPTQPRRRVDRREPLAKVPWPSSDGSPKQDWKNDVWPSIDWLTDYVADMHEKPRRRTVPVRVFSFFWHRPSQLRQASYRVEYSRACLYSRFSESRVAATPAEDALATSREVLAKAFAHAPGPQEHERLARWAWRDPGLANVRGDPECFPSQSKVARVQREEARDHFTRIVGRERAGHDAGAGRRRRWRLAEWLGRLR